MTLVKTSVIFGVACEFAAVIVSDTKLLVDTIRLETLAAELEIVVKSAAETVRCPAIEVAADVITLPSVVVLVKNEVPVEPDV